MAGEPLQTENTPACSARTTPFKLADGVVSDLMLSGRAEKLYTKWFQSPIPPRNINMNYPMSPDMKARSAERQSDSSKGAGRGGAPVRHTGSLTGWWIGYIAIMNRYFALDSVCGSVEPVIGS